MSGSLSQKQLEHLERVAVGEINRHVSNGTLEHGREWTKTWHECSLRWSGSEPAYVMLPTVMCQRLTERAAEQAVVFELAKFVVASRLDAGVTTPSLLAKLVSGYLTGDFTPPKRNSGPRSEATWGRNFIVYCVLCELRMRSELPVTENKIQRGVRSRNPILSEIMERAIRQTAMPNLQQSQIQEIWADTSKRDEAIEIEKTVIRTLLDDEKGYDWV